MVEQKTGCRIMVEAVNVAGVAFDYSIRHNGFLFLKLGHRVNQSHKTASEAAQDVRTQWPSLIAICAVLGRVLQTDKVVLRVHS